MYRVTHSYASQLRSLACPNGGLSPPRTGMFQMPRVPATLLFGSNHGSVRSPTDSSEATAEAQHTQCSEVVYNNTQRSPAESMTSVRAVRVPGKVAGSAVYEAGTPWLLSFLFLIVGTVFRLDVWGRRVGLRRSETRELFYVQSGEGCPRRDNPQESWLLGVAASWGGAFLHSPCH